MDSVWYYAHNNDQKGPVTGADLLALERSNMVQAGTLVWRAGMASWQPWASMAAEVRSAVGVSVAGGAAGASADMEAGMGSPQVAVCAYSGQTRPVSLMVKYGDRWVALEYKDAFVQSLREGVAVARMAGVSEVQYVGFWWRVLSLIIDGFVLIVPNLLVAAPYYYMSIKKAMSGGLSATMDPLDEFKTMDTAMLIAYVGSVVGGFLISLGYETWMVGKWGGTVGKLALGLRVTKLGGQRLTYVQALGRFGAKFVNMIIWMVPAYGAMIIGSIMSFGTGVSRGAPDDFPVPMIVGFVVMMLWFVIGGFGYYMAGWTQKKQALHDMMARTVVVKKNPY